MSGIQRTDVPEPLRTALNEDEKIIFYMKSGLFGGKKFQMITDKRVLEIVKGESKERQYLNDGEHVHSPGVHNSWYVNWKDAHGNLCGETAELFLLTNQRILFFKLDNLVEDNEYELPLKVVECVHIGRKEPHNLRYGLKDGVEKIILLLRAPEALCSILAFLGDQECLWLSLDSDRLAYPPSAFRENLEYLVRGLCDVTGLPLSPPERYVAPPDWVDKEPKMYKTGTVLEFYTNTKIEWPERCSSCEELADDYHYDNLKLDVKGYTPSFLSSIEYKVPYCSGCYEERNLKTGSWRIDSRTPAVKEYWDFNGINALIWFENESYALDFIKVNTK
jgi:hypothetical protein